jgi:hypothetical protein
LDLNLCMEMKAAASFGELQPVRRAKKIGASGSSSNRDRPFAVFLRIHSLSPASEPAAQGHSPVASDLGGRGRQRRAACYSREAG